MFHVILLRLIFSKRSYLDFGAWVIRVHFASNAFNNLRIVIENEAFAAILIEFLHIRDVWSFGVFEGV
jgi:hypothetical protein